jgi:hypothetical protein
VCDGPHTADCVQLVCGQRADCQRSGSLSDRSQQQQYADSHVGSRYLQTEMHWSLEDSGIHLTTNLINVSYFLSERDAVDFGSIIVGTYCPRFHFPKSKRDVELTVHSDSPCLYMCTASQPANIKHHSEW